MRDLLPRFVGVLSCVAVFYCVLPLSLLGCRATRATFSGGIRVGGNAVFKRGNANSLLSVVDCAQNNACQRTRPSDYGNSNPISHPNPASYSLTYPVKFCL